MNYPEIIKNLFRFNDQIKEYKTYNSRFYNIALYKFFFKWKYFKTQNDSLKFKIPWITFPAIEYLEKFLSKEMIVFEYGCGGSTLFFSERTKTIISVEHDDNWYNKMKAYLKNNNIGNVKLLKEEPTIENTVDKIFTSENESYIGKSFKNYVITIKKFPDNFFDVILIDGRARNACFIESIKKVKTNGVIIFDNTERNRYRESYSFMKNDFLKIEMPGPTPFSKSFTITTAFKKTK